MISVELGERADYKSAVRQLAGVDALGGDWDVLSCHVPEGKVFNCSALAFLAAWGMLQREEGRRIEFPGDSEVLRYLSRMNLFRLMGAEYTEKFHRWDPTGRFIPLRTVEDGADVAAVVNEICDLVLCQFDNAAEFLPALEWAVNEVIDNIYNHAEAPVPGVVCGQYYPERKRLDVAIWDVGRGIRASLQESQTLANHREAIGKALVRGVTRNQAVGQGNGLAGTHAIARLNGGAFIMQTGDTGYKLADGAETFQELPATPGTGVFLRLDTTKAVRLSDTFIGQPTWTFIEAEAQRMEEEGGLKIVDEVIHTGGRDPAKRLRRKIEALLPEMDTPLTVDFTDIGTPSTSFLDELLGRLAVNLGGPDALQAKVRLQGVSEEVANMLNVAMGQRLGGGGKEGMSNHRYMRGLSF